MRRLYEVSKAIEIAAPPGDCYRTICDFTSYHRWCPFVAGQTVTAADEATGLATRVAYDVRIMLPKLFKLVLEYAYQPQQFRLDYRATGGDVTSAAGSYQYRLLQTGGSLLTFTVTVDFGMIMPAKISNYLIDRVLVQFLESIRDESVRRYAAGM